MAELLEEGHRAELTYLIGRHLGQLKAKHTRLQWILIVISAVDSLKFLQIFLAPYFRATAKSGDQIAAACCGDIGATARMMNRLLVGKELGPKLDIKGVLDQAVAVRAGRAAAGPAVPGRAARHQPLPQPSRVLLADRPRSDRRVASDP